MVIVDTSVLVAAMRDRSGSTVDLLFASIGEDEIAMTRAIEMELLAGARDDDEWSELKHFIQSKPMLEAGAATWEAAAQIFFDLRRLGLTVRKLLDCWIAQIALENGARLVHNDRDFDAIGSVRPLNHSRLDLSKA